jgi:hypothetical protein
MAVVSVFPRVISNSLLAAWNHATHDNCLLGNSHMMSEKAEVLQEND